MRAGILALGIIFLMIGVPGAVIGQEAIELSDHGYWINEEDMVMGLLFLGVGGGLAISGILLCIGGCISTKDYAKKAKKLEYKLQCKKLEERLKEEKQ